MLHLRVEWVARMIHEALWNQLKHCQTEKTKVKTKKTLLQALKTLKTPCFLVTDNHVCVYVSPNAATSLVSSSGGALLILHEAAMIIYTQTSWLSVQTLRICSSGTVVLLWSPGNNYEKNKGRYSHVGDTPSKCWGKIRSFASGLSTVFLWNCKKIRWFNFAPMFIYACLYVILFFFIWCLLTFIDILAHPVNVFYI